MKRTLEIRFVLKLAYNFLISTYQVHFINLVSCFLCIKNIPGGLINEEEENGLDWSDKELDMHRSEVEEKEHVSTNDDDDDDLGDVFDWY